MKLILLATSRSTRVDLKYNYEFFVTLFFYFYLVFFNLQAGRCTKEWAIKKLYMYMYIFCVNFVKNSQY